MIVTGLTARAPAKINLQLSVGPRRPDGFHDLATIFHAVSLFDEVTVRPAGSITARVEGEGAGQVPGGRGNLAVQAAIALRKATGIRQGAEIVIRKRIPVAAGLAGGSADAAAALVACNKLWSAGLSTAELTELAAGLGSDVPFGLAGGTAVGLGRGDRLTHALASGRYHWVLAVADGGLSTAAVYAECDRLRAVHAAGGGPAGRRSMGGGSVGGGSVGGGSAGVRGPVGDRRPRAAVGRRLAVGRRAPAAPPLAATSSPRCGRVMRPGSGRCSATICRPRRCH